MDIQKLLEEKRKKLEGSKKILKGKTLTVKELKELIRKGAKRGEGFRSLAGKEILIKKINFEGNTAVVLVEVEGETKTVKTSDKGLIKRWLAEFKVALDMGAQGIKVKVVPIGSGNVKFE